MHRVLSNTSGRVDLKSLNIVTVDERKAPRWLTVHFPDVNGVYHCVNPKKRKRWFMSANPFDYEDAPHFVGMDEDQVRAAARVYRASQPNERQSQSESILHHSHMADAFAYCATARLPAGKNY